jgi:hypothetical protein
MTAEIEQYLRTVCHDNPKDFAALEAAAKEDCMTLDEIVRAALYDYIAMRALELGLPPFAARKKKTQTLKQRFAMLTRRMSAKARKLGPRFDDWLNTVEGNALEEECNQLQFILNPPPGYEIQAAETAAIYLKSA